MSKKKKIQKNLSFQGCFIFPQCLKKTDNGNMCEMLSQQRCTCFPIEEKNQWRVVFYEIKLVIYNGSAYQHNLRAHILLHFPSFSG